MATGVRERLLLERALGGGCACVSWESWGRSRALGSRRGQRAPGVGGGGAPRGPRWVLQKAVPSLRARRLVGLLSGGAAVRVTCP